jgi:hypothetical protein
MFGIPVWFIVAAFSTLAVLLLYIVAVNYYTTPLKIPGTIKCCACCAYLLCEDSDTPEPYYCDVDGHYRDPDCLACKVFHWAL